MAQRVRHAPGLSRCEPVWRMLRSPYGRALRALSARHGLPLEIGGHTIRLNPRFANLNWETVEPESYRAFAAAVGPGDAVFDVGAHFGTYTLIAFQRCSPSGRVIAYEPCPLTRQYLAQHLAWNGASERVLVRPVCCGAMETTAPFYFRPDVPEGINGLLPEAGLEQMRVRVTTIDREVDDLRISPTVLKIDVEGAELDVLKGAERFLAARAPRIFLSLHPDRLESIGLAVADVTSWLSARGFTSERIAADQEVHVVASRG